LAIAIDAYGRDGTRSPSDIFAETVIERDREIGRLRARLVDKKRFIFDELLKRLQGHATVLDETAFAMQKAWKVFRRFFIELGSRLQASGRLDSADDIFFLDIDTVREGLLEPESGCPLALFARQNRVAWSGQLALSPPRCIPPPDHESWQHAVTWPINLRQIGMEHGHDASILRGIAASPGQKRGKARVCKTLKDAASLQAGEILVAANTTPNWTPLFSQALAVVTDVGAATSHSSIVAREFRIPAVVGTQRATQVIGSGDQLFVDGSRGLVYLEELRSEAQVCSLR
jgi:pyruvate,water dikinase